VEPYFPVANVSLNQPWVWDAVRNTREDIVDVIAVSRWPCVLSRKKWRYIVQMLPQYSDAFARGDASNVFLNVSKSSRCREVEYARKRITKGKGLFGDSAICFFYANGKVVHRSLSLKIDIHPYYTLLGTIFIRCPWSQGHKNAKELVWDELSVQWIHLNYRKRFNDVNSYLASLNPIGPRFPACIKNSGSSKTEPSEGSGRGTGSQNNINIGINTRRVYKYDVSVCTATGYASRRKLVEWIEYHKLLGVQHFFIYDMASFGSKQKVKDVLADYLAEGTVTIVPWRYSNCVKGMGGGRDVRMRIPDRKGNNVSMFIPPAAASHTAALASCYLRFSDYTKYMIHIDEDEFIALADLNNTSAFNIIGQAVVDPSSSLINDFAQKLFDVHPSRAAIGIVPVLLADCIAKAESGLGGPAVTVKNGRYSAQGPINTTGIERGYRSFAAAQSRFRSLESSAPLDYLPRLSNTLAGTDTFKRDETKLIMRTDRVAMFHVHFVTYLKGGQPVTARDDLILPTTSAALLHFRSEYEFSGSVWGFTIPTDFNSVFYYCRIMSRLHGTSTEKYPVIPDAALKFVLQSYRRRMTGG
jgi:Glycosyltransferase family 92